MDDTRSLREALTAAEQQVAELRGRVALLTHPLLTDKERALRDTVVDMAALLREAKAARDAAREETARVRELLHTGTWLRLDDGRTQLAVDMPPGADLSCRAYRDIAIDAALTPTPPQPAARTEEGL